MLTTEKQYQDTLDQIETFLQKGSAQLNADERLTLRRLSVLAEGYEQRTYPMPMPAQSLVGMIQIKMFERRLKQKELATLLDISETTLSEILSGKRRISLDFAKKLYQKLDIPADFILQSA